MANLFFGQHAVQTAGLPITADFLFAAGVTGDPGPFSGLGGHFDNVTCLSIGLDVLKPVRCGDCRPLSISASEDPAMRTNKFWQGVARTTTEK